APLSEPRGSRARQLDSSAHRGAKTARRCLEVHLSHRFTPMSTLKFPLGLARIAHRAEDLTPAGMPAGGRPGNSGDVYADTSRRSPGAGAGASGGFGGGVPGAAAVGAEKSVVGGILTGRP